MGGLSNGETNSGCSTYYDNMFFGLGHTSSFSVLYSMKGGGESSGLAAAPNSLFNPLPF